MKWVCNYCQKIVEKDNFIGVLEEGMEDDEYHAWRRIMEIEQSKRELQYLDQLTNDNMKENVRYR